MYCPICDQKTINCDCTEEERRMYCELEEVKEQLPRWIPVSERVPERNEMVCVVCEGHSTVGTYSPMMLDWWAMMPFTSNMVPARLVTHWMPLPEPPEATQ